MGKKNKATGTKLTFTWIKDINLIPRYLVEQVEPKEWDTDKFYQLMKTVEKNILIGAFFTAKTNEIKGFLCANINPLTNILFVHVLSLDKQYQGKGILKEAVNILKKHCKKQLIKKINWLTVHPIRMFRDCGAKESEQKLLTVEV